MDAWMMDVDAWIGGYGWIWMGLDVDGDGRTDAGIQVCMMINESPKHVSTYQQPVIIAMIVKVLRP